MTNCGRMTDPAEAKHRGTLSDYAYPGSRTIVEWAETDRRTFHGEWPGVCPGDSFSTCVLPVTHRGEHAT
jgi:hypothetical protein